MEKIEEVQNHMRLAEGWEIFRRYLVMNAFDGLLSVLGVVIGAFFLGTTNPRQVVVPGLGAAIAIGISGSWIAYLTEEAENVKNQKELEVRMITDLDDTRIAKATRTASIINSAINGISPFFFGAITLLPFMFVSIIPIDLAFYLSFGMNAFLLFILGMFLARIAQQNMWIFGVKTLFAGIVVGIFLFFIG